jgi:hypothetical protein
MLLSFAYLAFSAVLRLLISDRRSGFSKDVELLVLRHHSPCLDASSGALRSDLPIAPSLPR